MQSCQPKGSAAERSMLEGSTVKKFRMEEEQSTGAFINVHNEECALETEKIVLAISSGMPRISGSQEQFFF